MAAVGTVLPKARYEFMARCAEIDRLIAELSAARADHFGAWPHVNWGDVGSLDEVSNGLQHALKYARLGSHKGE